MLSWESLHLTAWSRRVEHNIGKFSTNAEHPVVERYLGRMLFSLVDQEGKKCESHPSAFHFYPTSDPTTP